MAERRSRRKRREADEAVEDDISQKRELEIAKYLRSKVPTKKTTLLGHKVDYFIASKAIDCLLDSKWATNEKGEEPLFTTRESVVEYMQRMLVHQYFHRAQPIPVRKKDTKRTEDPTESSAAEDTRDKKKDRVKKDKKDKADKETEKEKNKSRESSKEEKVEKDDKKDTEKDNKDKKDEKEPKENKVKKEGKDGERKKEKPRFKLDMHLEQVFVDGNNPYVWIYEPTPVQSWVIGILVLIAATAICLFPLWPRYLRNFVYYLSIAGAGFLLFVFSLVILRFVIFVIIWLLTFGKHNFWILPNLTEDVGVLESFWPLYQYEYKGGKKNEKDDDSKEEDGGDKKDKKKQKKQKSEDEQSDEGQKVKEEKNGSNQTDDDDEETEEVEEEEEQSEKGTEEEDGDNKSGENAPLLEDEDASSNPIKSNNGDADNGFEILDVQESSETS